MLTHAHLTTFLTLVFLAQAAPLSLSATINGLAPEVTDLNSADVSYHLEAKLPDLKEAYISIAPSDMQDGIPVGQLGTDGVDKDRILTYANGIAAGLFGNTDSLLVMHKGKLVFESYYRRGRENYPHYQMSITKSYTAMALGRAIQLGYLSMDDLDKPVVSFLKDIDQSKIVAGADQITVAQAMNMGSGIRIDKAKARELMKQPAQLKGQGQIEAYMTHSTPIPPAPRAFKYQGADPSMTMQMLEAVVPVSAKDFIRDELLAHMGITNYAWQDDISGLLKSAAGSSFRSRDMLKWGMLVTNQGVWQGEQLIPAEFVDRATSLVHTNQQSGNSYGYFWWRADMQVNGENYDCKSGRGAGGQFILMLPELELVVVTTAHNKGMGKTLANTPKHLLPAFIQ
jgi:CubicO group peptidase (beta-lactamase class C family)